MLNYAYAVLEAQVRIKLVSQGYDPTVGIMHHDYRGGPAFVLDHMEPLRPVVDREVLRFAFGNELHPADFGLQVDGVCRLNPQLASYLVKATAAVSGGVRPRPAAQREGEVGTANEPIHLSRAPKPTGVSEDRSRLRSTLASSCSIARIRR
jgi:hypothetical protein